jgi:hypothetical protein
LGQTAHSLTTGEDPECFAGDFHLPRRGPFIQTKLSSAQSRSPSSVNKVVPRLRADFFGIRDADRNHGNASARFHRCEETGDAVVFLNDLW